MLVGTRELRLPLADLQKVLLQTAYNVVEQVRLCRALFAGC